jgi:acetyl-CoA carboxylase biotin carboxyl carrier protein
MTQRYANHLAAECDGTTVNEFGAANPAVRIGELAALLDCVRHHAVLFLSETPALPRVLRVRAGEVSIDIEWAQEQGLATLNGAEIEVAQPMSVVAEPVTDTDSQAHYLTSPAVGVFYRAPESGATPFISEGDVVVPGQRVGLIEAMKLMIPVEADKGGRMIKVLKDNGEPVEYGERLFALAAADPNEGRSNHVQQGADC